MHVQASPSPHASPDRRPAPASGYCEKRHTAHRDLHSMQLHRPGTDIPCGSSSCTACTAVAAGVSIPARARLAIATGVAVAVAWRVRYSLDRSKQLGLMSCRYSVCAIARRLRATASKRAEQLLGITATADHVNGEQSLNSVSERLLLSTDRNCWHALFQPDIVRHGNEQCIPDLHQ